MNGKRYIDFYITDVIKAFRRYSSNPINVKISGVTNFIDFEDINVKYWPKGDCPWRADAAA